MQRAWLLSIVVWVLAGSVAAETPLLRLPGAPAFSPELQARLRRAAAAAPLAQQATPHRNPDGTPRYVNRLALAPTPYLQEHAFNPVNWYPWGKEAFAVAQREGKPIFLSIGFFACHWCRIMAQGSFDDPAIAEMINRDFVAIHVDREERPDVDALYTAALQKMAGRSGWPLNIFLTPDGEPLSGDTYLAPEEIDGRPALPALLHKTRQAWQSNREGEIARAKGVVEKLRQIPDPSERLLDPTIINRAGAQLAMLYDAQNGGFGKQPKFPQVHTLQFLLRYWQRSGDEVALGMVTTTLDRMSRGAITDLIGGGMHRYTSDAAWRVPNYEKMLYDQALDARIYIEAFRATRNPVFNSAAREILTYALRDLKSAEGAFYSAEVTDINSAEDTYYTWTRSEIITALGAKDGPWVADFFGLPEGSERGPLSIPVPAEEFMKTHQIGQRDFIETMAKARAGLFALRKQRPRPVRDEKIMTGWNGLMIAALADASLSMHNPQYEAAARHTAEFILTKLQKNGRLMRSMYRGVVSDTPAFLDDYAYLILGLHQLYEATLETRWLIECERLTRTMVDLFKNPGFKNLRFSASDHEILVARIEALEDTALPAGESVAAYELLRIGHLVKNLDFTTRGRALLSTNYDDVSQAPSAYTFLLVAEDFILGPGQEIVIAASAADQKVKDVVATIFDTYLPRALVIFHGANDAPLERLLPFLREQKLASETLSIFICQNYECEQAITKPHMLPDKLRVFTTPMRMSPQ